MKNSACGGLLSCITVVLESVEISERSRVLLSTLMHLSLPSFGLSSE